MLTIIPEQWCTTQEASCPLICLQLPGTSGQPQQNNCTVVSFPNVDSFLVATANVNLRILWTSLVCATTACNQMLPNIPKRSPTLNAPHSTVNVLLLVQETRHVQPHVRQIIHVVHKIPSESTLPQLAVRCPKRLG